MTTKYLANYFNQRENAHQAEPCEIPDIQSFCAIERALTCNSEHGKSHSKKSGEKRPVSKGVKYPELCCVLITPRLQPQASCTSSRIPTQRDGLHGEA